MLSKIYHVSLWLLLSLPILIQAQAIIPIHTIQGADDRSSLIGQSVVLQPAVVTGLGSARFFAQVPDEQVDNDPNTSEGILISGFISPRPSVGDLVEIRGTVLEIDGMTAIADPGLEVRVVAENQDLPTLIRIDPNFPTGEAQPIPELERVEGMRIELSGMVCAPSAEGDLFAVRAGNRRSYREPGIRFPGVANLPVWDGNPERFFVNPGGLNLPDNRFVAAGGAVELTGVLTQWNENYVAFPERLDLEAVAPVQPVRPAQSDEIAVASFNVLLLDRDRRNYELRIRKIARYLTESLRSPHIIALQEIGGEIELQDLQFQLELANPGIQYERFFLEGNDNVHTAFLARTDLGNYSIQQLGKNERFTTGGRLHNRPPLLLTVELATQPAQTLQVLNVHVRSLDGSEDGDADFVFEKRHEQAKSIARMIEDLRSENLIVLGDFNAFAFSDGFVDVIGQVSGQSGLPAQFPVAPILSRPLRLLSTELPEMEQYSFVFKGDAQQLDHALVNDLRGMQVTEMAFARGNADAPTSSLSNDLLLDRASDHDGLVVYLQVDAFVPTVQPIPEEALSIQMANPARSGSTFSIYTTLPSLQGQWMNGLGQLVNAFELANGTSQLIVPPSLPTGVYHLQLHDSMGRIRTRSVLVKAP